MATPAPAKTPRNELILSNANLSVEEIRIIVWRELKIEVTANGINGILHRGKKTGDARARKRDRRWARGRSGNSGFNGAPSKRRKPGEIGTLPVPDDLPLELLPKSARLLMNADIGTNKCRWPLRGRGIGLIVCGADTGEHPDPRRRHSYCEQHRAIAYEKEDDSKAAQPAMPAPAVVKRTEPAERHMGTTTERAETHDESSLILPPDHFYAGLKRNAYGVIYTDPDVEFKTRSAKGQGRSPSRHYKTRPIEEIARDPVADLAAEDCFLWLWIPAPHIVQGHHLPLLQAWGGFKPSSFGLVWVKTNDPHNIRFATDWDQVFHAGLGFTTMQNVEVCILARRGSPKRMARNVRQVIVAPVLEHSRKPKEARRRIERYCGLNLPETPTWKRPLAVELHARESTPGWETWGDEKTKFDPPPDDEQEAA